MITKKVALESCKYFTSGVYKNNKFLLLSDNYIYYFNDFLINILNKKLCKSYKFMNTFCENFLVTKDKVNNKIFILSDNLIEINCINLSLPSKYYGTIESLVYDQINNVIIICTKCYIYEISIDGHFIKEISHINTCNQYRNSYVKGINGCCYLERKVIPSVCYYSCVGICNKVLYVGIIKKNGTYLQSISNNGSIINEYFIDDDIIINSIMIVCGKIVLLVTKNNKYNYIYFTNISCCSCKKNDKHCDCDNEIICSVAQIEYALAHILNTEGEKLQHILKCTDDFSKIMDANESVNCLITKVTYLEQTLCDKLRCLKVCKKE